MKQKLSNALYEFVALNRRPDPVDIGVGTDVIFEQGDYYSTQDPECRGFDVYQQSRKFWNARALYLKLASGAVERSTRWHLGVITSISSDANGNRVYSGRHQKGDADGKWVTWKGYSTF